MVWIDAEEFKKKLEEKEAENCDQNKEAANEGITQALLCFLDIMHTDSPLRQIPSEELVTDLYWRCEAGTDEYIAFKVWHREDIEDQLTLMGFEPSKENVDLVIRRQKKKLQTLAECTDDDWSIIQDAIRSTDGLTPGMQKAPQE